MFLTLETATDKMQENILSILRHVNVRYITKNDCNVYLDPH